LAHVAREDEFTFGIAGVLRHAAAVGRGRGAGVRVAVIIIGTEDGFAVTVCGWFHGTGDVDGIAGIGVRVGVRVGLGYSVPVV
jgi:hypothetical protein